MAGVQVCLQLLFGMPKDFSRQQQKGRMVAFNLILNNQAELHK